MEIILFIGQYWERKNEKQIRCVLFSTLDPSGMWYWFLSFTFRNLDNQKSLCKSSWLFVFLNWNWLHFYNMDLKNYENRFGMSIIDTKINFFKIASCCLSFNKDFVQAKCIFKCNISVLCTKSHLSFTQELIRSYYQPFLVAFFPHI